MWDKVFMFFRRRFKIIIVLVFVLALSLGYFIGRVNSSRDRIISKLEFSLKEGDLTSLRRIVLLNGKTVSRDELKPLMKYYNENPQGIESIVSSLKNNQDTPVFKIQAEKRLFFNTYKLELRTYDVDINTNFSNGEFSISGVKAAKSVSEGESVENLIPGVYTINGLLKSDYGDIIASKEFVLMKDEEVQVNFDAIDVSIQSIFKDADVYINDKYTGKTVDEIGEIGPFKKDGSSYISIEKDFPWGTIKSNEEYIGDMPVINLNIDMNNDELNNDLIKVSDEFYRSVFTALNNEKEEYIINAQEDVKSKIYSILKEKYFLLKNEYIIDDINIMDSKSEFTYNNGQYRANLIVEVDYIIEKKFFNLEKNKNSKKFFTKFIYDEKKQDWIVTEVENFSL